MITPGYSCTATERVLPRLALDFTTASLDARVSVTRALNTATRVNSSGYVETVNANLPRFDYSATSIGVCKGLLIEELRDNECAFSEDITNAAWARDGGVTTPSGTVLSPANTSTAYKAVSDNATAGMGIASPSLSFSAGDYCFSAFCKPDGVNFVQLLFNAPLTTEYANFNLTNGTVTAGTYKAAGVEPAANGFYRCWIVVTAAAVAARAYIYFMPNGTAARGASYVGNGTNGVFVWGSQIERGSFPTSYIPNLSTGATRRNADAVSMTGTNFSSWYNASEGAIFCQIYRGDATGTSRGAWSINSGATSTAMDYRPYASQNVVVIGGAVQAEIYPGGGSANSVVKSCFGYKVNSFAASTNGGNIVTDTSGNIPTVSQLNIGGLSAATGQVLCGHVQKISYWPMRITDAEVRAFSK